MTRLEPSQVPVTLSVADPAPVQPVTGSPTSKGTASPSTLPAYGMAMVTPERSTGNAHPSTVVTSGVRSGAGGPGEVWVLSTRDCVLVMCE